MSEDKLRNKEAVELRLNFKVWIQIMRSLIIDRETWMEVPEDKGETFVLDYAILCLIQVVPKWWVEEIVKSMWNGTSPKWFKEIIKHHKFEPTSLPKRQYKPVPRRKSQKELSYIA